ncbi:MAG: oligosaccharide flippase family protein, partial [Microcoleus sp. SIO2G3]|nr:oligosaccharide flippase family protein [Microcoleus sp. SIO2G3]
MLGKLVKSSEQFSPESLKIIRNMGWLLSGKVLRTLVSLLTSTWMARYLGPEQFGILQYAFAFSGFFLPLSTAQMGAIVTRELVKKPDDRYQTIGSALTTQIIGGLLAGFLSIACIFWVSPQDRVVHLLVAIVALKYLFNSFQPLENWFE